MNIEYHSELRVNYKWGTFGKLGNEPLKWIVLKDIHDDHLENIIIMMREYPRSTMAKGLNIMLAEQEYRRLKKIRVPFKFG